jgi:hypothetical protein
VWQVGKPARDEPIRVYGFFDDGLTPVQEAPQSDLTIIAGHGWGGLLDPDWRILKPLLKRGQPISEMAEMAAGLTVAEAYKLRAHVFDADSDDLLEDTFRLITSGLIAANRSRWGELTARFLGARFGRPAVRGSALPTRRLAQASQPKLIIGGMGLAPRAVLDDGRSQASVATVIITHSGWPLGALGALINSRMMGRLARAMFGALALGGGHIRFGKREIGRLPLPDVASDDPRIDELARLADRDGWDGTDSLVDEMYGLTGLNP